MKSDVVECSLPEPIRMFYVALGLHSSLVSDCLSCTVFCMFVTVE